MSKMTWHGSGTREIEAGVSDVALFPMGSSTYADGVAWNGVTAINENPSGADITDLYADNIKYASLQSAEKFGFGIEAYTYPDEWSECDGSKEVITGVFVGQQARKPFGLVYKTQLGDENHPGMDKGFKLNIVWNSTAAPSGRSYTTINDNPDAISFSWDANSTPVPVTISSQKKTTCKMTIKSTDFMTTDPTPVINEKLQLLLDTLYGRDADSTVNPAVTALTPKLVDPDTAIYILTNGTMPPTT